jgi:hypothetical protein
MSRGICSGVSNRDAVQGARRNVRTGSGMRATKKKAKLIGSDGIFADLSLRRR